MFFPVCTSIFFSDLRPLQVDISQFLVHPRFSVSHNFLYCCFSILFSIFTCGGRKLIFPNFLSILVLPCLTIFVLFSPPKISLFSICSGRKSSFPHLLSFLCVSQFLYFLFPQFVRLFPLAAAATASRAKLRLSTVATVASREIFDLWQPQVEKKENDWMKNASPRIWSWPYGERSSGLKPFRRRAPGQERHQITSVSSKQCTSQLRNKMLFWRCAFMLSPRLPLSSRSQTNPLKRHRPNPQMYVRQARQQGQAGNKASLRRVGAPHLDTMQVRTNQGRGRVYKFRQV